MKFVESDRSGEVLGNKVMAKPVPFMVMAKLDEAQRSNDTMAIIGVMCDVVRKYVKMEDGSDIDPDQISQSALAKLFAFATNLNTEGIADFT